MYFPVRETKKKHKSLYKTLYLSETLVKEIDQIACENNTSFNNVVVSMIEYCLKVPNADT